MTINKGVLKALTTEQVDEAIAFAWPVYQKSEQRTTPPYHSEAEMKKSFLNHINHPTDQVLGYYKDQHLTGVLAMTINHEERYCSSSGGFHIENSANYNEVAGAFLTYLSAHCKGYRCHFGTTKPNVSSQKFLEANGFVCTEDSVQTRIGPSELKAVTGPFVVETLTEADYATYRQFHKTHFSEYYWSADKIYEVMPRWNVSIAKNEGQIVGSVFTQASKGRSGEVYGSIVLPEYENTEMMAMLLYESTAASFKKGATEIVNFIPEGYLLDAALKVGYVAYDTYMCFEHKALT